MGPTALRAEGFHDAGPPLVKSTTIGPLVADERPRSGWFLPVPPPAVAVASKTPAPSKAPGSRNLRGTATWYRWHRGEAAAGPALRRALGSHWRGRSVRVCSVDCITVRLTDWCLCRDDRLVDLDRRSFAKLAAPSVGVLAVRVYVD